MSGRCKNQDLGSGPKYKYMFVQPTKTPDVHLI